MWMHYLSLGLVVMSNTGYHLSSRSIPEGGNQFLGTCLAYLAALMISLIAFTVTKKHSFREEWKAISKRYALLGCFIPGLETGFILMYHNGWQVSQGALVAEVSTCALLVVIGIAVFKDRLSRINLLGVILCFAGVIMAGS
jgi:uncharacterized membrane protein